jgi:hypothetical protein
VNIVRTGYIMYILPGRINKSSWMTGCKVWEKKRSQELDYTTGMMEKQLTQTEKIEEQAVFVPLWTI